MNNIALYLDDARTPQGIPQGFSDWVIVRSYEEFVNWISNNGMPDFISWDHDLSFEHYTNQDPSAFKEKTGFECAKWLVEYCLDNVVDMCKFTVHSANPGGSENILSLLNNLRKMQGLPCDGFRTAW